MTAAVETSSDLDVWASPGSMVFLEQIDNGDGTVTMRYRSTNPIGPDDPRIFARVSVTLIGP